MPSRPTLNRALARAADFTPGSGVRFPTPGLLDIPERVVQFGTGGFLRGFVEYFIDTANRAGRFSGRVVAVSSTESGRDELVMKQDGLYTLLVQGIDNGNAVRDFRVVSSLSRSLSAGKHWDAVLDVARNPAIELVFSNTTEVGIVFDEGDSISLAPPRSFPGKLTAFLHERARHFDYDPGKGLVVLPCELIEDNGARLREVVLSLSAHWRLGDRFTTWVGHSVTFCNTLVDRIVSGTPPATQLEELSQLLGYRDDLLTICEPYRLFAIEATAGIHGSLGFAEADQGVLLSDDIHPWRERKVRVLNGAHSILVPTALLCGCETVFDAVRHETVGEFLRIAMFDEIVPSLDVTGAQLYAAQVLERFSNPFIEHSLFDITLHGTEKFRVRVVPSILAFFGKTGHAPACLAFGFAALLLFMRGEAHAERRASGRTIPRDDKGDRIAAAWSAHDPADSDSLGLLVTTICADRLLWGVDLASVPGFPEIVAEQLGAMIRLGVRAALEQHLATLLTSGSALR
jgi:Mannitol-1-phosphate/altronate dehydrogenases